MTASRRLGEGHTLHHRGGDLSCSRCVESFCSVSIRMILNGISFIQTQWEKISKKDGFVGCPFERSGKAWGQGNYYIIMVEPLCRFI